MLRLLLVFMCFSANAADRDNDGLSDEREASLGTDPQKADTDGDSLPDGWEVDGHNDIDLAAWGANPLRKDIFVEMDYMVRDSAGNGLAPNDFVISEIVRIFAEAPVENPDGSTGISIHLDLNEEVPYQADISFSGIRDRFFSAKRASIFHYMVWANGRSGGRSSGYSFGIPSGDFYVSLGRWNDNDGGTDLQKIGTFIHELGHNLGLKHGGVDHSNYKPNYLSVMNYNHQTRGVPHVDGPKFEYQPFTLPNINENSVSEKDGLGDADFLAGYSTRVWVDDERVVVSAEGSIDWNQSGMISESRYRRNLNKGFLYTTLRSTSNEWQRLRYDGGAIGKTMPPKKAKEFAEKSWQVLPYLELTEEEDQR